MVLAGKVLKRNHSIMSVSPGNENKVLFIVDISRLIPKIPLIFRRPYEPYVGRITKCTLEGYLVNVDTMWTSWNKTRCADGWI